MRIKIDKQRAYKSYLKWAGLVLLDPEWKNTVDLKEVVYKICNIIEDQISPEVKLISDEELERLVLNTKQKLYGVYHKPTKLWVYFRELKDKFGVVGSSMICLCLKPDATTSTSAEHLANLIKIGEFNSEPLYGQNNFLEFQIKKIA